MRVTALLGLAIAGCSQAPAAEVAMGVAPATIEIEANGNCSVANVQTPAGDVDLEWQACHGWQAMQCGDDTLLVANGVSAARAHLLRGSQVIDFASSIDSALAETGQEYLHLAVTGVCDATELAIQFSGSRIGQGESGSATEMSGRIERRGDMVAVIFVREEG